PLAALERLEAPRGVGIAVLWPLPLVGGLLRVAVAVEHFHAIGEGQVAPVLEAAAVEERDAVATREGRVHDGRAEKTRAAEDQEALGRGAPGGAGEGGKRSQGGGRAGNGGPLEER